MVAISANNEIHAIVPVRLIIEKAKLRSCGGVKVELLSTQSAISTYSIFFMAVCMAPILFSFNYLMDRQFHKLDGIKARIDGLRSLMKSEYSALMESEQKKLKDFQTKY